ncbi:hypothetical protein [Hymenobacter sp. UYCo722]|uniref:hypothetical protein n=1 Tax=Hymenobacter sp. UYCo722 TaxID=3156335 RepID=UPI00339231E9
MDFSEFANTPEFEERLEMFRRMEALNKSEERRKAANEAAGIPHSSYGAPGLDAIFDEQDWINIGIPLGIKQADWPTYKRQQLFLEFQPFDSLEEILKEWPQSTTTFSEVKFVKPSNLADWQSTLYRCATMVKVFKTLDQHMAANTHQYNFIYECKTLFKSTTHVFGYDPKNFAFVIRTGLGSSGQVIKNKSVPFYKQVNNQLQGLINEMKKELPKAHFDQVFALYTLIKDKKRA